MYFCVLKSEVSHNRSTFIVVDLPPSIPIFEGGGGGVETTKHYKKYFTLPNYVRQIAFENS